MDSWTGLPQQNIPPTNTGANVDLLFEKIRAFMTAVEPQLDTLWPVLKIQARLGWRSRPAS